MKKTLTTIIVTLIYMSANAQIPNWAWAKSAGRTGYETGLSVSTDATGNVYVTGSYSSDSITFGAFTLSNVIPGYMEMFLAKYDAMGNVLWAKRAGSTGQDIGMSVSTDGSGNVYVTGYFDSPTITFGAFTLNNAGINNVFIVKYDGSGNVLWAKVAGGQGDDRGNSICTDTNGNVYVTGWSQSPSITFGAFTLINTNGLGGADVFLVKYDTSGNVLWARGIGGIGDDAGYCTNTDASGNVYVTGYFDSPSITFGAFTLINADSISYTNDMFLVKYDAAGNVLWAKGAGGDGFEFVFSTSTDATGNVFVSGSYNSLAITFGAFTLNNALPGTTDMFIVKYDASGNVLWAKGTGGINHEEGLSTITDASGNVYVTGYYESDSVTFGAFTFPSTGGSDIFIVKYDASGNVLWAKSEGSLGSNVGYGITSDGAGNLYLTGFYFTSASITFGAFTLTNAGSADMFIAKLSSTTTGVEEIAFVDGIFIYPNPAYETLTINTKNELAIIKMYNVLGEETYNTQNKVAEIITIDISTFEKGIYIVEVQTEIGTVRKKIIKN